MKPSWPPPVGVLFVKLVVVVFLLVVLPGAARSDDALVLPKGRANVAVENFFYFPTTKKFNPEGDAVDIAGFFNNRRLDSTVFPVLKPLDPVVGGHASIGDSFVKFTYDYDILDFSFQYGITDKLTAGFELPYYWVDNRVKALLNSGPGSSANVGLRTGAPFGPCTAPVLPLTCPNTRPFTTEDVQQLLGPGLAGIPGFGFKRIDNFFAQGFGDLIIGAKYQYLKTEDWRLAATAGVRFPTGRGDDPDDLSDIFWTSGAYALLLRLHHDYIISNLWRDTAPAGSGRSGLLEALRAGQLFLNFTFRYDLVLPDRATVRAGTPDNPVTTTRARVDRDLGDRFEFEVSAHYRLLRSLSVVGRYKYGFKLEDHISGPPGFPNELLEKDTNSTEQLYVVRVNYSTLPLYLEGNFPLPLLISLSYRDRFAGSGPLNINSPSGVLKTRYIGLGVEILF